MRMDWSSTSENTRTCASYLCGGENDANEGFYVDVLPKRLLERFGGGRRRDWCRWKALVLLFPTAPVASSNSSTRVSYGALKFAPPKVGPEPETVFRIRTDIFPRIV